MPRPPSFDADLVLNRAMLLFWTQGYAGTSLHDLVAGTELLNGSLYHAFGNKRSLYIQTLHRYGYLALQQTMAFWDAAVSARENLRAMFMVIVDLPDAEKRRGSMLCNCIAEVVPHDAEIARVVQGILSDFTQFFHTSLSRAQQAGEVASETNITALARYLVSSIQGVCTMAKAGATRDELLDIVTVTLSVVR